MPTAEVVRLFVFVNSMMLPMPVLCMIYGIEHGCISKSEKETGDGLAEHSIVSTPRSTSVQILIT